MIDKLLTDRSRLIDRKTLAKRDGEKEKEEEQEMETTRDREQQREGQNKRPRLFSCSALKLPHIGTGWWCKFRSVCSTCVGYSRRGGGDEFSQIRRPLSPLAAQNRALRIARFPESRAWNRQKFRSEKHNNESNRSKLESQKIDSESPSKSHPINAQSDLGMARFELHDSESHDFRFRIADSVP